LKKSAFLAGDELLDFRVVGAQRLTWEFSSIRHPGKRKTMALDYKIEPQPGHLRLICEGRYEPSLNGEFSDQVLGACEKYRPSKMLIDTLRVEGEMSTMDRYNLATLSAKKYLEGKLAGKIPGCRFAFVGSNPLVDPKRFGETVAVNRGIDLKVFTEMKEALAWLEADPAEE
jgi:hypothetical protein